LGHWIVPDRSSRIADDPRSDDITRLFIAGVEEEESALSDRANADLIASIKRLKEQNATLTGPKVEWKGCELARGNSIVVLTKDSEGQLTAVKTARGLRMHESYRREIDILKKLNHPLVVRLRESPPGATDKKVVLITDFVENGSLADHLPDAVNSELCQLSSSTVIMRIIAGIVLAMRFLYSQNIIHGHLTPDNILLDWKWNVRICDFGDSLSPEYPRRLQIDVGAAASDFAFDCRYLAPECFYGVTVPQSDVFSFGMILYELIFGRPVFPKDMSRAEVIFTLASDNWFPDIPDTVVPVAVKLIRRCLAVDYENRPAFIDILH
jgi:serine/threonine protein kinase